MSASSLPSAPASPPAPTILVSALTYTYPGRTAPAVDDVSFDVAPGEIFGFLGPSGAGKSTTQRVLTRLLTGARGDVRVLGRPLADWGDDYYRRIGISFELPSHYLRLTARENLDLFAGLYGTACDDPDALLDAVGLADDADVRVAQYSKGMMMRLNLVRALLHRPELLFLDEPTTGMDPVSAGRIKDLVRARRDAGTTVFLTTHDMALADDLCDRVAFMIDGRLAALDTPRALKLRAGKRVVTVETRRDGVLTPHAFAMGDLARSAAFTALLADPEAIETIHTAEATLEQVFVAVTGRQLA